MVRCQSRLASSNTCPAEFIVNPLPEFSQERPSSEWQLTPQRISLKNIRIGNDVITQQLLNADCNLITGESYNISVQFTPAKNYPLDLYFLMDLSNSMGEHRRNVEKFGSELARKMRDITSNFKLGFGSFVDKDTIPIAFDKTDPELCFNDKGDMVCRQTYSFKHRMTMDSQEDRFVVSHCDS